MCPFTAARLFVPSDVNTLARMQPQISVYNTSLYINICIRIVLKQAGRFRLFLACIS